MFREKRSFPRLVDARLEGKYPGSGLPMVIELTAMCLREEPHQRPNAGDIVEALEFLSSKQYSPKVLNTVNNTAEMESGESSNETTAILPKESVRERAVAEAKLWGETWRQRRQSQESSPKEAYRL